MAFAGTGLVAWCVTAWAWQDPITGAYSSWSQHRLAIEYRARVSTYHRYGSVRDTARRYRLAMRPGTPVGRLRIPRLALDTILVDGTDAASLKKGPGLFRGDGLPGEGGLVYVAGHRTTYGAPFGHIERLKRGDKVTIQLPYGTFVYAVARHRIVTANDVAVLRSHEGEQLILQSCHPRFSASHRFLVYARPIGRAFSERKRKVSRA